MLDTELSDFSFQLVSTDRVGLCFGSRNTELLDFGEELISVCYRVCCCGYLLGVGFLSILRGLEFGHKADACLYYASCAAHIEENAGEIVIA